MHATGSRVQDPPKHDQSVRGKGPNRPLTFHLPEDGGFNYWFCPSAEGRWNPLVLRLSPRQNHRPTPRPPVAVLPSPAIKPGQRIIGIGSWRSYSSCSRTRTSFRSALHQQKIAFGMRRVQLVRSFSLAVRLNPVRQVLPWGAVSACLPVCPWAFRASI